MDSTISDIKHNSAKLYDLMNMHFTKNLLDINTEISNEDAMNSKMYSRVLNSAYNMQSHKDAKILNDTYFLRFAPFYMSTEKYESNFKKLEHLVAITTLALRTQRINEVRITLRKEDLSKPDYETMNWLEVLYSESLRLFLLMVRKENGWSDINEIKSVIEILIAIQVNKEKSMIEEYELSQMEIAQLIALYNTIAALKEVNIYLESGNPSTINVRLGRYKDNIIACFNSGLDAAFKNSIENIINGIEIIINSSIWRRLKTGSSKDKFIEIMVDKSNSKPIFELLPSQIEAFSAGITDPLKSAVIIQMHTSAGKSLLAHYMIIQALEEHRQAKIAYVVPTRALMHQVLYDLKNTFGSLNLNIISTIPAYEIDAVEEKVLDEKIDILVTTPEKLNLLIKSEHQSVKNLTLVIVDEAHNISDKKRGLALEFLLATIRRQKEFIKIIMLTPFIKDDSNRELVANWLGADRGLPVHSEWKPTRQIISIVSRTKEENDRYYKFKLKTLISTRTNEFDSYPKIEEEFKFKGKKPDTLKSLVTNIALKYSNCGNVLILSDGPSDAEEQAVNIAESINEVDDLENDLKLLIKFAQTELGSQHNLVKCLEKRVAFHHSGLPEEIRILVENLISKNYINYIVGTTTLAQGMNFPISTVIIKSITFTGKNIYTRDDMSPETFWNIAGRAGRVFKDFVGRIIFVAMEKKRADDMENYLNKEVKGINSAIFETIKNINEFSLEFKRKLIFDNPEISQFLQFISHTFKYVKEKDGINDDSDFMIDEIIRLSLAYKQLEQVSEHDRLKMLSISKKYINSLKRKNNWSGVATLVDKTGFSSVTIDYLMANKDKIPDFNNLTLDILNSNINNLTELVEIIGEVPEISLGVGGLGQFSPELVAKVAHAWISGKSMLDIYNQILKNHLNLAQSVSYIYRSIATKLSWGIGAMQTISMAGAEKENDIVNLPSMVYYGVPNDKCVLLRMAGMPRSLAIEICGDEPGILKSNNLSETKKWLNDLTDSEWSKMTKKSKLAGSEWKRIWEIIEGK